MEDHILHVFRKIKKKNVTHNRLTANNSNIKKIISYFNEAQITKKIQFVR